MRAVPVGLAARRLSRMVYYVNVTDRTVEWYHTPEGFFMRCQRGSRLIGMYGNSGSISQSVLSEVI